MFGNAPTPSRQHSRLRGLDADDHTQYVHNTIARTISAGHTFTAQQNFDRASASGIYSLATGATGDAVRRFALEPSGKMEWGSGATARDIFLSRSSAGNLLLTGANHVVQRDAATSYAYFALVNGDTVSRFGMSADGKLEWGSGAATREILLYRSGAGVLQLSGAYLNVASASSSDFAFAAGYSGTTTPPFAVRTTGQIELGSGSAMRDLTLSRAAAGVLAIGTTTQAGGLRTYGAAAATDALQSYVTIDSVARFNITAEGTHSWGTGSAIRDLTMGRISAGVLGLGTTTQRGAIRLYSTLGTEAQISIFVGTEANARFTVRPDGKFEWGDGASAADTMLQRYIFNGHRTLFTDASLRRTKSDVLVSEAQTVSGTTLTYDSCPVQRVTGAIQVNLPAGTSIQDGTTFEFHKTDSGTTTTISGNGFNINGSANYSLTSQFQSVRVSWSTSLIRWMVL